MTGFRLMRRPSALPVSLWAAIFEGLGLRPGLIRDPNQHEEAVRALQKVVGEELERTVRLEDTLKRGLSLWNEPIFTDVTIKVQDGTVIAGERPKVSLAQGDLLPSVREYKQFLEGLKGFTTVGRLRNLRLTSSEVDKALASRQVVRRTQDFVEWVTRLQPLTAYLAEAQGNMPPTHAWSERAEARKADLLDEVRRHARGEAGCNLAERERELETLKEAYISAYAAEHRRLVLGPADDERRAKLYDDRRLRTLEVLSEAISLFNKQRVEAWKRAVQELPTCRGFYEGVLKDTPTCPYCHLRPAQRAEQGNAAEILDSLDENLSSLLADWRRALADALKGERAQRSLDVMTPEERRSVEAFLAQQFDAADLPRGFIESAQKALRGLEVVSLSGDRLLEHLKAGGLPCTEEELQRRFAKFLRQALRGRDAESTRLTLE
ncbi:MAG: hypothetical protein H5T66_10945 [Chloroflexi bacterium]|nr:hypothetical protein [Chloroflexota bacterium]